MVNENGIIPKPKKVQGITDFKAPTNQKEMLRYLGMLNYYPQSLPKIAATLHPLYAGATKKLEKGETFTWTAELQKAFDDSKKRLREYTLLVHPDPEAPLAIVTDASFEGIGGALEQFNRQRNCWQPLGFYSRHLTAQRRCGPHTIWNCEPSNTV